MMLFNNHLKKLLKYSWISSIMFKSSSTLVEKSPPSSSSFVSCDHLCASDVEMGWVSVEQPSQSSDSFPTTCLFDRSVSSSSIQFTITVEETETDLFVVDVPLTPSPVTSMADHSVSSNQAAFNSSLSSLSTPQTAPTTTPPPPFYSSSDHASISRPSNPDIDHSTSSASSATAASFSSSSSISSSYQIDDSISSPPLPSTSSSSSSNHAPTSNLSSNSASTRRHASRISSHKMFVMHSSFKWHEILLAVSFTVPVGLLSATFERHKGILVPAKLFTSNPNLFLIFITLDALAFTASVIGILLQALGKKRNKNCLSYLSLFAFTALVFAFSIYLSVLLPNFLGFISWTLLIIILLVLLYVGVSMYNRSCSKNHRGKSTSTTLVATTATIV